MKEVKKILENGVLENVFSGASSAFGKFGENLSLVTAGKTRVDDSGIPVVPKTLFDLASLTKVLFTTTVLARWVDRKEIFLKDGIVRFFPELKWHTDWYDVSIQDVLHHTAGFEAWADFMGKEKPGSIEAKNKILERIASSPKAYPKRSETRYSDLGFILLAAILEKKSKKILSKLFDDEVRRWIPKAAFQAPPVEGKNVAATEDVQVRGGIIQGEVHDNNAWMLGGLWGHAGLFGTAQDCANLGFLWLDAIERGNSFLSQATAKLFSTPFIPPKGEAFTLGWMTPTQPDSSGGKKISLRSIGHLGYTGTSIWIDLERKALVVLLTNRIHPSSKNEKIKDFRPKFYDLVWEVLD